MSHALSVLIPTLNCNHLLPSHIDSMRQWIDLANEIIIVDSNSNDGTCERLIQSLAAYNARVYTHPRGLYQSWNYGIGHARSKWLYISTVGDTITRDLLLHLLEIAEKGNCDAVLSKPDFVDQDDRKIEPPHWAIHDILSLLPSDRPYILSHSAALFFTLLNTRKSSILGSAASNIFKTSHLKLHPFPCDWGTCGDGVWGIQNVLQSTIAFTHATGSTFKIHEKSYDPSEYYISNLIENIHQLGMELLETLNAAAAVETLGIGDIIALRSDLDTTYADLKRIRAEKWPWLLHASAWRTRSAFKRKRHRLLKMLEQSTTAIRERHLTPVSL